MAKRILLLIAAILAFAPPVHADPTSEAKAVADKFGRAMTTCDMAAVGQLYEEDAVAIFPYLDDEAKGRAKIIAMAKKYCGAAFTGFKQVSAAATQLTPDYIVNIGAWQSAVDPNNPKSPIQKVRTTEVLHKGTDGNWRYVVDHASIGQPPPRAPVPAEKT